jgi:uncharacterized protein YdhG (YjbR/CyaY superfamily)
VPTFATIDDYIGSFPEETQSILQQVRRTIQDAVPAAGETVRYGMPTITLDGKSLVHFAAWKHHIGLYPLPDMGEAAEQELAPYRATRDKTSRDSMRIPSGGPIPFHLITRVVVFLVERRQDSATRS